MSIGIYDISVPVFADGLKGLTWVLAKAVDHFNTQGGDPDALIEDRLVPDMLPFGVQVSLALGHSLGCLDRLSGQGSFLAAPPKTLAEAQLAVRDALAKVQAFTAADLVGAETRRATWDPMGNGGFTFDGLPYLIGFATPNFYFHRTMAYALVRKAGVNIGKRDYMALGEPPPGA